MSWGAFWMYYRCPGCGRKFRWELGDLADPAFGRCPGCGREGALDGESGAPPPDPDSYPDCGG